MTDADEQQADIHLGGNSTASSAGLYRPLKDQSVLKAAKVGTSKASPRLQRSVSL